MGDPLLQQRVANIRRFLVIEAFKRLERELIAATGRPRALQLAVGAASHAQREPDAVLHGCEVLRPTNPDLTGSRAANRINPTGDLALFVGREGCLPVLG